MLIFESIYKSTSPVLGVSEVTQFFLCMSHMYMQLFLSRIIETLDKITQLFLFHFLICTLSANRLPSSYWRAKRDWRTKNYGWPCLSLSFHVIIFGVSDWWLMWELTQERKDASTGVGSLRPKGLSHISNLSGGWGGIGDICSTVNNTK